MGSDVFNRTLLHFNLLSVTLVAAACILLFACQAAASSCAFPALFSFGTSLSDTGNGQLSSRIFRAFLKSPYGETYFGRPVGRFCDGRIVLDFLAESVGLPFLPPYLAYKETTANFSKDFSKGINYAVSGATVQNSGSLILNGEFPYATLDSLRVQLGWHLAVQQAAQSPELAASSYPGVTLPSPIAIANGLYYFEFGGNDYGTYFLSKYLLRLTQRGMNIENSYVLSNVVPVVIQGLVDAIELLYANSARNFIIFNIVPEGCASLYLKLLNGAKDQSGCLSAFNAVDAAHNQQLASAAEVLRSKYPDINLMIADYYGLYTKVLQNPSAYGFSETLNACCGAGPGVPYQFTLARICRASSYICPNPSIYMLWDGIHNTEALNRIVVNNVISGEFLTPSNGLACASSV